MTNRIYPHIRTPTDLGNVHLGNPYTSLVPVRRENRIDRDGYGRILADLEGGIFTPQGYVVPRQPDCGKNSQIEGGSE